MHERFLIETSPTRQVGHACRVPMSSIAIDLIADCCETVPRQQQPAEELEVQHLMPLRIEAFTAEQRAPVGHRRADDPLPDHQAIDGSGSVY